MKGNELRNKKTTVNVQVRSLGPDWVATQPQSNSLRPTGY